MNSASQWRLRLAEQIAPAYAAQPKVRAVAVLGSVSRGWADRYSDVELGIVWNETPSDEERQLAAERAGGSSWRASPFNPEVQGFEEDYEVGGVKIDLGHFTVETAEAILADVLERHETSLAKQNTLSALRFAIPLHGTALIKSWQARAERYPTELALAMVREHLSFSPRWIWAMFAERDEWLLLRHNLTVAARKIVLLLMGLNRIYYPGHKWVDRVIGELQIAPSELSSRLKSTLTAPAETVANALGDLVEETFALVDRHMPEAGTAEAWRRLREPRKAWECPPEGVAWER